MALPVNMDISASGLAALAGREGVRTLAYRDTRGIWTIGVGHTAAAGAPIPCAGMEMSYQAVMDLYRSDLKPEIAEVNRALNPPFPISQNQFDACVSLCHNIGIGGFAGSSVVRDINAGDIDAAAKAFLLWDHPEELLGRRKAEMAQFLAKGMPLVPSSSSPVAPSAPDVAEQIAELAERMTAVEHLLAALTGPQGKTP
jgi:lysozyme